MPFAAWFEIISTSVEILSCSNKQIRRLYVHVYTIIHRETAFYSQGPPRSGEFLQIWRNDKFQNWRNSPDLEKLQIFDQFFVMEESIVTSYNYSGTCIIYWRIKQMNFVPRQGTRKKVI